MSKALYALRMVKNTLNQKSLLLLYNSIFHCHLLYAIQIWSCSRSGLQNEIFKMQKAAIRIVSGSSYNSHTEPLFKKLQVLPLPDLITFSKLQFMHRFSQKFLPFSFNDTWIKNSIRNIGENEIQLRNFNQLQHTHSSLASLDVFPLYNFPKLWQDFPDEHINPFTPKKKNLLRFSPKLYHITIAFHGFQNRWNFCDISFRFWVMGKRLVYIFFLTVHIFKFLIF